MQAKIDEHGRLVLPPEAAAQYGLTPGLTVRIDPRTSGLHIRQPVRLLGRVYVEPTNCCNLDCRTCIRNVWDEPLGRMTSAVFAHIIDGLRAFEPPPTVFFGGFGEPLAHSDIVEMVAQCKSLGASVELITNGTLLTPALSLQLIQAGLDMLWVSLDGATPESYADVRLGAALPEVLANVAAFKQARPPAHRPQPKIGIAFVAMKRNIADLPAVLNLGRRLGATHFLVSNVLPHTAEMYNEVLYTHSRNDILYLPSPWMPQVSLPKIDIDETTRSPLYQVLRSHRNVTLAGANVGHANNRCPFIENSATAIRWDGGLSPCLPLVHSHVSFLNGHERFTRRYTVGTLGEHSLSDLWNSAEYAAFREHVQRFDYSPCTFCGGCDLVQANEEDCIGNTFPTCGGCLWAQGVIQCP